MKVLAKDVVLLKKEVRPNLKGVPYLHAQWVDEGGNALSTSTKETQLLDQVKVLEGRCDVELTIRQGKSDKGYWTIFALDSVRPKHSVSK